MARVSKQPQERRQELVEAAQELFLQQGYDQTAVSDIVKKVGVAQGLFYYYFNSKKDIFLAVIDQFIETRIGDLAVRLRDEAIPPLDRFHNMVPELMRFLRETESMYPRGQEGATPEMYTIVQNHVLEVMEPMVEKIIREGITQGVMSTLYPSRMARFFISGFMGVESMPNRPQAEEMLDMILYTVERLLGVPRRALDAGRNI